jgi:hypothetical protein
MLGDLTLVGGGSLCGRCLRDVQVDPMQRGGDVRLVYCHRCKKYVCGLCLSSTLQALYDSADYDSNIFDTYSTCDFCCSFLACEKGYTTEYDSVLVKGDVPTIKCYSCKRWMHEGCGVPLSIARATATQDDERVCSFCEHLIAPSWESD